MCGYYGRYYRSCGYEGHGCGYGSCYGHGSAGWPVAMAVAVAMATVEEALGDFHPLRLDFRIHQSEPHMF